MMHVCPDSYENFQLPQELNTSTSRHVELLKHLAPTLDKTILYCRFRGKDRNCSELFSPMINDDGVCFTFNSLPGYEIYRSDRRVK